MATSNKMMGDMLRSKRTEMAMMPGDEPYEGPPKDDVSKEEPEAPKFQVMAPGEPRTGTQFEYEPMMDIPGAWAVYPPGTPCDESEYRIMMDKPATADDFGPMQEALDSAEANQAPTEEIAPELGENQPRV